VLAHVVRTFQCTIPQTVYDEVVINGKAHLHKDAEAIEAILADVISVHPVDGSEWWKLGLGAGEIGILALLPKLRDAIVVSDDRRFLAVLATQDTPFLTPTNILVILAHRGILTKEEARDALERLRPAIRLGAYWDARQELEIGGQSA
jgi:hypothetical protein